MANVKLVGSVVDRHTHKLLTIDGSASQNIYQVNGLVRVHFLYGIVDVALAADATGAYLEVDDGTAQVVLTLVAGAPDISSLPVGSYLVKSGLAVSILDVKSSAAAAVSEVIRSTVYSKFVVVQKTAGVATYIRLTRAGAGASGRIHWHIGWSKVSDDANIIAA